MKSQPTSASASSKKEPTSTSTSAKQEPSAAPAPPNAVAGPSAPANRPAITRAVNTPTAMQAYEAQIAALSPQMLERNTRHALSILNEAITTMQLSATLGMPRAGPNPADIAERHTAHAKMAEELEREATKTVARLTRWKEAERAAAARLAPPAAEAGPSEPAMKGEEAALADRNPRLSPVTDDDLRAAFELI
ncbi:hypothetical protein Q8F55_004112 [Vanrija albida]|uniref:Mediator of RNA polymerase II transcription subunit 11 n=1 Tax=Vanrija albida TaxID=181172 RepID=A0ABR3Q5V1_9TREE